MAALSRGAGRRADDILHLSPGRPADSSPQAGAALNLDRHFRGSNTTGLEDTRLSESPLLQRIRSIDRTTDELLTLLMKVCWTLGVGESGPLLTETEARDYHSSAAAGS